MNRRKLKVFGAAVIAIICAALILITGTYAFQIITQQGFGRSVSRDQFPTGRLHVDQEVVGDNFGELNWYLGQSANNEVYVENFGDSTPLFTRVRLLEYMEIGIGAQLHPNDSDFADRDVKPLVADADRLNPTTWAVVLPHSEEDGEPSAFRDYWALTQDGGSKYFMPTFNQDAVSREPDVKGDAWGLVPMLPELPNSTRRGLPHAVEDERPYLADQVFAYPPEAGLSDYFEQNPTYKATVKTYDWNHDIHLMDTAPVSHEARETLDAKIMTMEQWHTAGKPVGNIWVLDTDGWAYWASALEPGDATGLLLNEMTYISPAMGTIYYAIYADAQMAAPSSWELAFQDLTDDAEDLMNTIANPAYDIILSESGTVSFPEEYASSTQSADRVITVTNAGNYPTGALSIELSGANPESFELSTTSLPNLMVGESTTFTVHSRDGLEVGMHTATVTVSGDANITVKSFNVSILVKVVPTYGISLNTSGTHTFPEVTLPSTTQSDAHPVTVTNMGNQPTGNLTVALSGANANSFTISATSLASIAGGEAETFTVQSNASLAVGTYTATVTVSGDASITAQSFNVSIVVKPVPTYGISLSTSGTHTFPEVTLPRTTQSGTHTVTITNTGNQPTGELTLTRGGTNSTRFTLNPTSRIPSIPVGGTATFTVRSNASLAAGTHSATVTVGGTNITTAQSFNVSIVVKDGITLMREGLVNGAEPTSPFLTLPIQRQEVERFEVINQNITNLSTFAAGSFGGRKVLAAVDVTHADSDYPVVAFHTAGNTDGRYNVYIAGHRGVAATGGLDSFFRNLTNATSIDVMLLDTSRVTTMFAMFMDTHALTTLNVSGWDTSSVTNMQSMFYGASSLKTLNLSGWNTSRVTNMFATFFGTSSLTTLNMSGWNTSSVTNMQSMFYGASSLKTLDLSGWNTSRATNMSHMFRETNSLTALDLSKFNTSNVTLMNAMFYGANSLATLNLSGFDTLRVTNMSHMFYGTNSLTTLDLSGFDTSNVTNMRAMFYGASSLTTVGNISGWNTSRVTDMGHMFYNTPSLTNLDFRKATFGSVTTNDNMFIATGINTITVGSPAARDFIQNAPGWADVAGRTITVAP